MSSDEPVRPPASDDGGPPRPEFITTLAEQLLGSALDIESRLETIAGAALGTVADSLTVFLFDYDGSARLRVARHRDPILEAVIEDLAEVYRPDPSAAAGSPVPAALAGEERAADWRSTDPADEMTTAAVARLGSKAWLAVPLRDVTGAVLGVLRFSRGREEPPFSEQETDVARHLAAVCDPPWATRAKSRTSGGPWSAYRGISPPSRSPRFPDCSSRSATTLGRAR